MMHDIGSFIKNFYRGNPSSVSIGSIILPFLFIITACSQAPNSHLHKTSASDASLVLSQSQEEVVNFPADLSKNWFERAVNQIEKREYFIQPLGKPNVFAVANSKQQLGFILTPQGYSVKNFEPDGSNQSQWQFDFDFRGIIRAGQPERAQPFTTVAIHENVLRYTYQNYSVEYVNSLQGLRQNFIIHRPLRGDAPLEVIIGLRGDLLPKLENAGQLALYSRDRENEKDIKIVYDQLKVWDANHKLLPARMELRNNDELVISVDDQQATYPITIDPLNHVPDWTDSGGGLLFPLLDDLTTPLLYGFSVSGAGDLNGDGFSDVIIGVPAYVQILSISDGTFNPVSVGAAFVYFGSAAGLSANPNEVLQPTSVAGALCGFSVSTAGDADGDGKADVVIGAPGDHISLTVGLSTVSVAAGKVYIYYGTNFDGNINTTPTVSVSVSLNQSDFGVLVTTPANPLYGFSVNSAGDVNNDGKSDIIVGSPAYSNLLSLNITGRADIYHGSASGIGTTPSRIITGGSTNGLFGYSVSSAGKVNNDSFNDIIIGAPSSIKTPNVGAAFVFHGSASGITATSTASANTELNNAPGLQTLFGYSVSTAGDVNGDGRGDVIIGEPLALDLFSGSLVAVGKAHIFYGSVSGIQSSGSTQLTSPRKPSFLGLITGNLLFGFSVSDVKDVNCDGVDDIIIGEPGGTAIKFGTGLLGIVSTNALSGQVYIFFGKNGAGPADSPGITYFQTGTLSAANLLGHSVRGSSDVNGNGKPDFLIGAPNGTLNLESSITGIIGNTLAYITSNSVGSAYGYHGCVNALNSPPVAVNDNATTSEDTPVTFSVTVNDTDADGTINPATVDLDPSTAGIQNSFTNAQGSWAVNASGNVTFTPAVNFNGTASITYTVNDNNGATSNVATITVTVNAVNDAPVAVNDNPSTNEDTPVTFNVTANDTDVDGTINPATVDLDPSTAGIQNTITTAADTWSVNATGDVMFTPAANFSGTASVTYTVNDTNGATSNAGIITVTVNSVNDAPVAVNDNPSTSVNAPVTFNVTANDTDSDGTINPATVDLNPSMAGIQNTLTTSGGSWTVNASGNVTFTPAQDFTGTTSITYTVEDNSGATSNVATITVTVYTVAPPNKVPTAANNNAATDQGISVTFNITANDTDTDGTIDASTVDLDLATTGIQNTFSNGAGAWSVNGTGYLTFTPDANFYGTAALNYKVNDNSGATSNAALISIAVNAAPVAENDNFSTNEDTPANFTVTLNDTDADGTINVASVDLDPSLSGIQNTFSNASGSWSVNATGDVTFTPAANFNGPASITYTVNDNSGATSNVATISVTVNAVNDAPVAVNDNSSTNEDTPVTFNATVNDTDGDGTINPATVDLDPSIAGIQNTLTTSGGSWTVNASGNVTFTPAANFNGTASITYMVNDNSGATSNVATISVIVNIPLVAPMIGIAKSVGTPVLQYDGSYNVQYTVTVKNMGNTSLINVQVVDDLEAIFPSPVTFSVQNITATGTLVSNLSYNGKTDKNLLGAGSTLAVNATKTVSFLVNIVPNGNFGPFYNSATGTATDPSGNTASDISTSGSNPDPNGNGDPGDDSEEPTPIILTPDTRIDLLKTVASPITQGNCSYNVTYTLVVKNIGNSDLTNIMITDNIGWVITAPATYSVVNITSAFFIVNTNFDGAADINVLRGNNVLSKGTLGEVYYTLNIIPNGKYGPFSNTARVTASGPDDRVVSADSGNGTPATLTIIPREFFIPEGFSPNGDGEHDYFEITLTCGLSAKLSIYNRWGDKVYHSGNYHNDWDGASNYGSFMGKALPEGTYFYVCELSSGNNVTSFVTLKR